MPEIYRGATHELERLIRVHLFVVCPNNSGSTFVKNELRQSASTWNLAAEGQNTFGFRGPRAAPAGDVPPYVWASRQEWVDILADVERYDWTVTKRAWYFQASSRLPDSCVFVEKSPPSLLFVDSLCREFDNARFLFMIRNPYAAAEGILRRASANRPWIGDGSPAAFAARHLITCFRRQRENRDQFGDEGVFFTYERMCSHPGDVARLISSMIPELADLDLEQTVSVKGRYDEGIRNMNAEQIERLPNEAIVELNRVFEPEHELLSEFGYRIIESR